MIRDESQVKQQMYIAEKKFKYKRNDSYLTVITMLVKKISLIPHKEAYGLARN